MGNSSTTINGTFNVTSVTNNNANGYWIWTGTNMDTSNGWTNAYDSEGPAEFTVNISVVPLPNGTATIEFLPQGVGAGFMAQFAGFPSNPICMPNSTFVRQSSTQFTFTDNNPSDTDGNVYFLLLGYTVSATSPSGESATVSLYSPDPIIINKDPDNRSVTLPEPQLTAAHS